MKMIMNPMTATTSYLLLLVVLLSDSCVKLVQAQAEEIECDTIATCIECLTTDGCGFWQPEAGVFISLCTNECLVQDIGCYTNTTFEDLSAGETCEAVETKLADGELCATQGANSCSDCVETVVSDGSTPCQWFQFSQDDPPFCQNGCGMDGCGATSCRPDGEDTIIGTDGPTTINPTTTTTSDATAPPTTETTTTTSSTTPPTSLCNSVESCNECLETEGCGFWQSIGCASECAVEDISCFTVSDDEPVDDVCQVAENELADTALCMEQSGCDDCVATTLSDGISTCQWFPEVEACVAGCGMQGCGETTCAVEDDDGDEDDEDKDNVTESTVPPSSFNNSSETPPASDDDDDCDEWTICGDCVRTERCVWQQVGGGGSCAAECLNDNATCWSWEPFFEAIIEVVCQSAVNYEAEAILCSNKKSCGDCVATKLSNGTSTCQWFDEGQYCGNACNMNGCGVTTCDGDGGGSSSGAARLVFSIMTSCFIATLITAIYELDDLAF
jgi:hypothetical protein